MQIERDVKLKNAFCTTDELLSILVYNFFFRLSQSKSELRKIPFLKNGNKLKSVSLRGASLELSNTCCFDSIFQLFLNAAVDDEMFYNYILKIIEGNEDSITSNFLAMVLNVTKKGINHSTYVTRAELMLRYLGVTEIRSQTYNCVTEINLLCNFLLRGCPTLLVTYICSENDSHSFLNSVATLMVETDILINNEIFQEFFLHQLSIQQTRCIDCEEVAYSVASEYGMFYLWGPPNEI